MNGYRSFMDRQRLPEEAHRRLLALAEQRPEKTDRGKGRRWMTIGTLAACAALIVGLGGPALLSPGAAPTAEVADPSPTPGTAIVDDAGGFVAAGPGEGAEFMFPAIFAVDYADLSGQGEVDASIARSPGSFDVELEREEILKVFWGPEGKPEPEHFKTDTGDFPLFLMEWAGYTIRGVARYDETGALWELGIYGEKGEDSFALLAAPGRIPPTCVPQRDAQVTRVVDTDVSAWYRSYDRDGDGEVEHVVTCELLTHGVGVRFENVGSGGARAGVEEADELGGAKLFNAMVVNHLCRRDGALYLDHIARAQRVPAWTEETFDTLAQAGEAAAFAPYLPKTEPEGAWDFSGSLSYQEGDHHRLTLRWSRGYDDVAVTVWLPEGPAGQSEGTVDVAVPESYDWRLYDGPIRDAVPEEYQANFYMPTFRAGDMSQEVVRARGVEKDTGGMAYRFRALLDSGVVVAYDCSGVDEAYAWTLARETLGLAA